MLKAKFINEKYLNQIQVKEINLKKEINNFLLDNFFAEYYAENYKQENNIDNNTYYDEIIELDDFKNWLLYELECKFYETVSELENYIINDNIEIYRKIIVDDSWIYRLFNGKIKRLGIYWSYDKKAAEPHWGYNQKNKQNDVLIKSLINQNHINWVKTILANMNISYEDEKEINLYKNTTIMIKELSFNKEIINIDKIKNKTFLS